MNHHTEARESQSNHPEIDDQPFEPRFIKYLVEVSDLEQKTNKKPSRKKAKLDLPESIIIAHEVVNISRPRSDAHECQPEPLNLLCRGAHRFMSFGNPEAPALHLSRKPPPASSTIWMPLLSKCFVSSAVHQLLFQVACQTNKQSVSSGLSVSFDIELTTNGNRNCLKLTLHLLWEQSSSFRTATRNERERNRLFQRVYSVLFPRNIEQAANDGCALAPQVFYQAAHVPSVNQALDIDNIPIRSLSSGLFPFQRRALRWLLHREGVRCSGISADGTPFMEPCPRPPTSELPLSFIQVHDLNGEPFYMSDLFHVITRDIAPFREIENSLKGGILAEEMGLGKTVETIALILTHTRKPQPPVVFDDYLGSNVFPTGATLIVTPEPLKKQWMSEITKHAPNLLVMTYDGRAKHEQDDQTLIKYMCNHDVVVTTYNVLRSEIHFTTDPPARSRRFERRYERKKSLLLQFSWWRICLDEAQQVDSGVSAAAQVARLIPRVNAWGISGTPVKKNIEDLKGLLMFLRCEPFASYDDIWLGLLSTHKLLFGKLFGKIAMRHSKRAVRSELGLPPQKRYIITMPFTAVEEQHYQSRFEKLARECGFDREGNPTRHGLDLNESGTIDSMRRALAELKQIVLHPDWGPYRLGGTGVKKTRQLRTIEDVLDTMIAQSSNAISQDQRAYLDQRLRHGQLHENSPRVQKALEIWEETLQTVNQVVEEAREHLNTELEKETTETEDDEEPDPSDDDDAPDHDREYKSKKDSPRIGEARRRLRFALDLQHRTCFFIASAHFQIKSNPKLVLSGSQEFLHHEKLEVGGYDQAKRIRQEILHDAFHRVSFLMSRLDKRIGEQSLIEIPGCPDVGPKLMCSQRVLETLEALHKSLDEQAGLIDNWRKQTALLLLKPLIDDDEKKPSGEKQHATGQDETEQPVAGQDDAELEVTGREYEDSQRVQELLMVYTHCLRAAIADRQNAISGLANELVKHETQISHRQAKNDQGPAPIKMLELHARREETKFPEYLGSMRGAITDLRALQTTFSYEASQGSSRAAAELMVVQQQIQTTQQHMTEQTKAILSLEKELEFYVSATNARVEYYRQLQALSDSVTPGEPVGWSDVGFLVNEFEATESTLRTKIDSARAKYRFLRNLKAGEISETSNFCVICQSSFTIGVLTVCGHQFCKHCMKLWFRAHHNCPMCKTRLTSSMLHDITLKKQELRLHSDQQHPAEGSNSLHKPKKSAIYSDLDERNLDAIQRIELTGPSFATKIDTMIRHLTWLRQSDPGAKSIIFSQFKGFLDVLGRAFSRHRIGYTAFDTKGGIAAFKENPAIECFLLHARAHSSGLNLVNANHVFLCEPMLNTALELQAIARVDRIGQHHATTVWLYLIEGTVEESIHNLSVRRRLQHIGQDASSIDNTTNGDSVGKGKGKAVDPYSPYQNAGNPMEAGTVSDFNLDAANSRELEQAPLNDLFEKEKTLGEAIAKDDLWECLFGHIARAGEPREIADGNGEGPSEVAQSSLDRATAPGVIEQFFARVAAQRQEAQAILEDDLAAGGDS